MSRHRASKPQLGEFWHDGMLPFKAYLRDTRAEWFENYVRIANDLIHSFIGGTLRFPHGFPNSGNFQSTECCEKASLPNSGNFYTTAAFGKSFDHGLSVGRALLCPIQEKYRNLSRHFFCKKTMLPFKILRIVLRSFLVLNDQNRNDSVFFKFGRRRAKRGPSEARSVRIRISHSVA